MARISQVVGVAQGFKGTLSVSQVERALAQGIRSADAGSLVLRASDGGDGLLEALESDLVRRTTHSVTGPLGTPLEAPVGWLNASTAVVESRLVCGLSLLAPSQRDPLRTTSRGVGELVVELAGLGAQTVLVGLGGSATVDGGVGMARAWGFVPLDATGKDLSEGGGALADLVRIRGGHPPRVRLVGLADVRNPLAGDRGAWVYAAQKGAGPDAVERLTRGLERLAYTAGDASRHQSALAGAGAAGGLGFGILHFAGGTLRSGAEWFLERLGFHEHLSGVQLVVTGEGAFDATSLEGKLTGRVLEAATGAGVPAGLVAPRADGVPNGVLVETGGGDWDEAELARRAGLLVERALRTARTR